METIINYLDNMFATLPNTKQIKSLKEDILSNMEDKYHELKESGKSENEAIGIVISEFGNIDELMVEFDIKPKEKSEEILTLTKDEVNDYLEVSKKTSKLIGLGVVLCILGPALLILIQQLIDDGFITGLSEGASDMVVVSPLFLLVAIAVGMFIYAGMMMDKYKYIENSFELPYGVRKSIEIKKDSFRPTYILSIIIGVVLCILSPTIIFITSAFSEKLENYGTIGLFLVISVAVYIFIYFGSKQSSYKKLLQIDEYSKSSKEKDKVISAVAAIVWPLAVIIFLISGLVFYKWYINWIVFPITGLLFGMFSGVYSIIKEKK